ncbi:uncharacterized protein LOC127243244 isoform X2 [Andrographis paniculata]|nr:uncharacterized protein LOC127243244 isoform X2 [Andrographis paniculata]
MGDGPRGIQVFPDHFTASVSNEDTIRSCTPDYATSTSASEDQSSQTLSNTDSRSKSHTRARRKFKTAVSLLNMLSLRALSFGLGENDEDKIVLSAVEVKALQSELAALDQRESHCKAQIEHINEILRSAHLSGYLFLRMRWATFPGEPPPVDDVEVDDWLPRYVVLSGSCIYLYIKATDISPQDSTLLSDVVEVGPLPCVTREDDRTAPTLLHCFYILTRYGLRYECSSASEIQVDSWLAALRTHSYCKMTSEDDY